MVQVSVIVTRIDVDNPILEVNDSREKFPHSKLTQYIGGDAMDRSSHIKVPHICQCYILHGSNEKLYFNKFKSNLLFIAISDMIFLPCHL